MFRVLGNGTVRHSFRTGPSCVRALGLIPLLSTNEVSNLKKSFRLWSNEHHSASIQCTYTDEIVFIRKLLQPTEVLWFSSNHNTKLAFHIHSCVRCCLHHVESFQLNISREQSAKDSLLVMSAQHTGNRHFAWPFYLRLCNGAHFNGTTRSVKEYSVDGIKSNAN